MAKKCAYTVANYSKCYPSHCSQLILRGTPARQLSGRGKGVAAIAEMLNVTRMFVPALPSKNISAFCIQLNRARMFLLGTMNASAY